MKNVDVKKIEEKNKPKCRCFNPPFCHTDFYKNFIGIDKTNGRFGEVSILICKSCGSKWLNIFIEDEGFSESGRWCRGLITDNIEEIVELDNTEHILESLDWYFIGGSYYKSTGSIAYNKFVYDL